MLDVFHVLPAICKATQSGRFCYLDVFMSVPKETDLHCVLFSGIFKSFSELGKFGEACRGNTDFTFINIYLFSNIRYLFLSVENQIISFCSKCE